MLTGTADALLELLLWAVAGVIDRVVLGRDMVSDLVHQWSWSAMWPVVAVVAAALAVGAWTAFWDD